MEVRAELRRKYFRTLSRWTKQSYRRTSDTDDRWAGPHPEGITLVARHVDHTRILSMRDAWSHLVGKCSETPPSNIETRTYQVDGEKERERQIDRETERNLRAHKATARGIRQEQARAIYVNDSFPGVSESRSLIFPTFCEHITRYSGDIFAKTAALLSGLPVAFLSPDDDDDATDPTHRSFLRRIASQRFYFSFSRALSSSASYSPSCSAGSYGERRRWISCK